MTDLATVLDNCLEMMAQGQSLENCLQEYPEHRGELARLLPLGVTLSGVEVPAPTGAMRLRGRTKLLIYMDKHPQQPDVKPWAAIFTPLFRQALAAAFIAMTTFMVASTALAQYAMPGERLYSWKLSSEQVWRTLKQDKADADVKLLHRRLEELLQIGDLPVLRLIAQEQLLDLLIQLDAYEDPAIDLQVQLLLKDAQLHLDEIEGLRDVLSIPGLITETPVVPTLIPDDALDLLPGTIVPDGGLDELLPGEELDELLPDVDLDDIPGTLDEVPEVLDDVTDTVDDLTDDLGLPDLLPDGNNSDSGNNNEGGGGLPGLPGTNILP